MINKYVYQSDYTCICTRYTLKACLDRVSAVASVLTLWKEYIDVYLFHTHQAAASAAAAAASVATLDLNGPLR